VKPLRIAFVAGEISGDQLGAALIRELRQRVSGASFVGIAGPKMIAAGCDCWARAERLAVMGLFEVLCHLPDLLRLRSQLLRRLLADPPDVFVGIDAPEFNLGVARQLRSRGVRTVQYVSPQVWAWRQARVRNIARAEDLVLCLFPFEQQFYEQAGVRAEFVGHPLADQIPLVPDQRSARRQLGLDERPTIAVLPGSRTGEVSRLGGDFAATIAWLAARRPELQFVAPMADEGVRADFETALKVHAPLVSVRVVDGHAQVALAAADVVLVASGTATLEATLSKRPMVVAYRLSRLTGWLVRRFGLMKAPFFAQPNLLAGRAVVPELFQEQVTPESLGSTLLAQLDDRDGRRALEQLFTDIHIRLRRNASARAAAAILGLLPPGATVQHA
jgi:lipid-A-disaccharide synthase